MPSARRRFPRAAAPGCRGKRARAPESRAISARAAAFASPQMPTEIGLTRPSIRGSASIWMTFAFGRPVIDAHAAAAYRTGPAASPAPARRRLRRAASSPPSSPGSRAARTTADDRRETSRCADSCWRPAPAGARPARSLRPARRPSTTPPPQTITGNFAAASSAAASSRLLLAAGAALDRQRTRNLAFDVAVEIVARNVELRRPQLEQRAIERARGELGHARAVVHVRLVLGDLGEDRQLLGLLEAAQAERHRCPFPA